MKRLAAFCLLLLLSTLVLNAQSIYWKKDHIYAGAGGKEIAVVTPPSSDTTAPSQPTGLSVTVSATTAGLSWTGTTTGTDSTLAGFKVYRQKGNGANLPVGTVSASSSSTSYGFIDQPLDPSTSYTYSIIAFDNAQNHSTASSTTTVTTSSSSGDGIAPTVPTGLSGYLLTRNSVRLTWNQSTDTGGSGVKGYNVYTVSGTSSTLVSGGTPLTSPTFDHTGLSYNTSYSYAVKAVDNVNNTSSATASLSITTDRQIIGQDDFNSADNAYVPGWNGVGGNYVGTDFSINSHTAYSGPSDYCLQQTDCDYEGSEFDHPEYGLWGHEWRGSNSVTSFRLSIRMVDLPTSTSAVGSAGGFVFFGTNAQGNPDLQRGYRAYITASGYVCLAYESRLYNGDLPEDWDNNCTGGGTGAKTGILTVEANRSANSIKVYVNGVLKISTTINSAATGNDLGLVAFSPWQYWPSVAHVRMDNFLFEQN